MSTVPALSRERVKELFLEARELEAAAREAFLSGACGEDTALRRRIEALLRAETALGPQFLSPAPALTPALEEIERYELFDIIGEGGFGTVYRARRRQGVETEVAIKVLRAGSDSAASLERFRAEQRSLEAMDHPGIARVLDVGATRAGRPFIVMELVRGSAITGYCEQERLSVLERVSLMAEVCRAVQHAHNKGVVHRDLKPSNILAGKRDGESWAKVIDFGVAKAITDPEHPSPMVTRRAELVGTPAYMSPEQARGPVGDVDTRADVYALGAVLYELLCGQPVVPPEEIASASAGEIEQLICDAVPPAPSHRPLTQAVAAQRRTDVGRLRRRLQGELDWIVMRALEKDRARRYPTAQALGDDLERVTKGEAVQAAPPSRVYRFSRLVRREPGLFAGLAVAILCLVVGAGVSLRMSMRARAAEQESDQARRVSEAVNNFLRKDLLAAVAPSGSATPGRGRDVKMREVVDEASRRIDAASGPGGNLEGEPLVQAAVHETLSETYLALGEFKLADEHAESAFCLYRTTLGSTARETLQAQLQLARITRARGQFHEALDINLSVLAAAENSFGERDPLTIDCEANLAALYCWGIFDFKEAEKRFQRVYDIRRETLGPEDPQTLTALFGLGRTMYMMERFVEAEKMLTVAWEARARVLGERDPDTLWAKFALARVVYVSGPARHAEAERMHNEVLEARLAVQGEEHLATLASMLDLGEIYLKDGRWSQAEVILQRSYDIKARVLGEDHIDTIVSKSCLGEALAHLGRKEEGIALATDAVRRLEKLTPQEAPDLNDLRVRLKSMMELP